MYPLFYAFELAFCVHNLARGRCDLQQMNKQSQRRVQLGYRCLALIVWRENSVVSNNEYQSHGDTHFNYRCYIFTLVFCVHSLANRVLRSAESGKKRWRQC
jgi:hypothetical protein